MGTRRSSCDDGLSESDGTVSYWQNKQTKMAALAWTESTDTSVLDACSRGDWDDVLSLLRSGAPAALTNEYGRSPLHFAVEKRAPVHVLEALIRAGAPIDAATRLGGMTPLHLAAYSRAPAATIAFLVRSGADATALDAGRKDPASFAIEWYSEERNKEAYEAVAWLSGGRQMLTFVEAGRRWSLSLASPTVAIASNDASRSEGSCFGSARRRERSLPIVGTVGHRHGTSKAGGVTVKVVSNRPRRGDKGVEAWPTAVATSSRSIDRSRSMALHPSSRVDLRLTLPLSFHGKQLAVFIASFAPRV